MGLTVDLKLSIYTILNAIDGLTVLEQQPDINDSPALYCYYSLRSQSQGEADNTDSKNKVLQIDVWSTSASQDHSIIDNICDLIDIALDEVSVSGTDFYYDSQQINRLEDLPTDNNIMFHTQLSYELKYNK